MVTETERCIYKPCKAKEARRFLWNRLSPGDTRESPAPWHSELTFGTNCSLKEVMYNGKIRLAGGSKGASVRSYQPEESSDMKGREHFHENCRKSVWAQWSGTSGKPSGSYSPTVMGCLPPAIFEDTRPYTNSEVLVKKVFSKRCYSQDLMMSQSQAHAINIPRRSEGKATVQARRPLLAGVTWNGTRPGTGVHLRFGRLFKGMNSHGHSTAQFRQKIQLILAE